ncbi:S-layer homology domain-containing protein [Dysosmobacter sp.]|uniref:S-layer homology domain-containing protein n=1 Tax=Dysosmobacter sp. TaxID=2591382 RepID=UPI003AB527F0
MKKTITLLLTLCLLLGLLPTEAVAYLGDIQTVDSGTVTAKKLNSGSWELRNDYLRVIVRKDGTLSTAPAADSADPVDRQTPFCYFVAYGTKHTTYPANLRPKSVEFVDKTPNGPAVAVKVEYDLTVDLKKLTATGTTTVYYEIVQLRESGSGAWGVLTSVNNIVLDMEDSGKFFQTLKTDVGVFWGYTLSGFTAMGHRNAADSPALKMNQLVYNKDKNTVISTENSVITSKIEDLRTWNPLSQGNDSCSNYITEVYTDGYNWANPFVGLSEYYKNGTIKAYLPEWVSVTPASRPGDTRVECGNAVGLHFKGSTDLKNPRRFLWGFRGLLKGTDPAPTNPDKVDPAIYAKRLGVFAVNGGVTVEYVADDAALEALKRQYKKDPAALINGDYESKNGEDFTFTGGAALLSPSVTATWGSGGRLVIHKNGTVEQSGVSLSAPTFKFYQPKTGEGSALGISLTKKGFEFAIEPAKNDAIVYVDIPYATVKLENAAADAAGNLVFSGEIGFQTIFEGAEFKMEKLGYGLKGNEFKVNGVHATGSFTTAKMMALELADVKGEVNTFNGNKRYAFELERNVFDLFETKAELELTRSKKDGSLLPNTLYFYVKASPGIPLIPPIPVGQLNGGGAGFMDLAKTVNGDYFAIPPIKLRGTLTGTYLHLIEGTGDVVIGPSEISLKATDVGIVGVGKNGQIIESFGYALKLNGQEREYKNVTYNGIYLAGSEELELNLPSRTIDVIVLNSSIELGAFGGVNKNTDTLYLGIGANGIVKGTIQVPSDIPVVGGIPLSNMDVNLIVGGQTTMPISGASVSERMKDAFKNIDVYLGAMAEVDVKIIDVRVWVLVPQIVKTGFRRGEGWGVEHRWVKKLPKWDWEAHGVTPVVQAVSLEDGEEALMLTALEPVVLTNGSGENSKTIEVRASTDETPYILLAFDSSVSEEDIKQALIVTKKDETNRIDINWVGKDGEIDPTAEINAGTDLIENVDGNKYRVVLLRLKKGGTYEVNTGDLKILKQQEATVTPFEKLNLNLTGNEVSGEVEYAEMNTGYTLRTYLAEKEGGADYLIDEQIVKDTQNISVTVPTSGTHAPTGSYYVTSFLMTEKSVEVTDENGKIETVNALAAIDSWQSKDKVSYTNSNQPAAPANVTLTFVGNEVMRAEWGKVDDADGYRVTVYQKDGSEWKDTGFGYDLKKPDENGQPAISINMALTVGGEETKNSKNLSPNETYKVGVSAYKEEAYFTESAATGSAEGEETGAAEGTESGTAESGGTNTKKALTAKYYSPETTSSGVHLPKYEPLHMTLTVNGIPVSADENGVYHAYVGEKPGTLTVTCDDPDAEFTVTQMDDTDHPALTNGNYEIPTFEGSLMLKIDGKQGMDVTSVFLLVSRDVTPPVLTLSDPVFFADQETGAYTVTGTADAGSEILYGGTEKIYASSKGRFTVSGTLDTNSGILSLSAKDSAGNESAQQLALITRQTRYAVTVNGSYADASGEGKYAAGSIVTVRAGSRSGYTFNGWTSSGIRFDEASAAETTFTMPEGSVTVTANWTRDGGSGGSTSGGSFSSGRDDSDPSYAVGIPDKTENGSVSVSPKNASQGDRVTVTVKPDAGYELDSLKVFDKNGKELELTDKGDGKFTFIMPAGKVEVKAAFTEEVKISPFRDVPTDAYYYEAVKWAQKKGITGGIGDGLFGPNQPCTRAQIVTFLWRAAGSPEPKGTAAGMTDVAAGSYYEKAVAWAIENGITTGTADGRFAPDATCTRAQGMTFLFRASKASADGAPAFSDVAADAYYAEAVKWATDNGITNGTTSSTFSPGSGCTRAQIVMFLWRLYAEK